MNRNEALHNAWATICQVIGEAVFTNTESRLSPQSYHRKIMKTSMVMPNISSGWWLFISRDAIHTSPISAGKFGGDIDAEMSHDTE